jgi:hypothetical protein
MLPLVPGMITDNLVMCGKVANGCQGTIVNVKYDINDYGERRAVCAYVKVPGASVCAPGLPEDVVPIMPEKTVFKYKIAGDLTYYISRWQLPLVPAYAFTANEIQGQSLEHALVDLKSAKGTQALYVMISRGTALENLAILHWFPSTNINHHLSEVYRNEFT